MSIGEGTHLWVTHKNQFLTTKPEGEDQQSIRVNPHLGRYHIGVVAHFHCGDHFNSICHAHVRRDTRLSMDTHVWVQEKLGNELNHTGGVTHLYCQDQPDLQI